MVRLLKRSLCLSRSEQSYLFYENILTNIEQCLRGKITVTNKEANVMSVLLKL